MSPTNILVGVVTVVGYLVEEQGTVMIKTREARVSLLMYSTVGTLGTLLIKCDLPDVVV